MKNFGLLLMIIACACVVRVHETRPVAPPPPPAPMTYDEVVSMGSGFCQSRGYQCFLKKAELKDQRVWKVKFRVLAGDARGKLHLQYDAFTRDLIHVDENVKAHHGHGNGHEEEEDD